MITLQERFETKFEKTDGCWRWKACKNQDGYGWFQAFGRHQRAHRFSYQLYVGPIPEGLQVLHKCDCPDCVRPDHLFLGTQADNMHDCMSKGRWADVSGEQCSSTKLTEEQVREIMAMCASGVPQRIIAEKFKVSQPNICSIARGRTWSQLKIKGATA